MPTGKRGITGPLSREVASILRARMGKQNVDQKDVAEGSGIPASTLSRLLNDKKHIYIEQLDAICRVLGLDIGDVLDRANKVTKRRHLSVVESRVSDAAAKTELQGYEGLHELEIEEGQHAAGNTRPPAPDDTTA